MLTKNFNTYLSNAINGNIAYSDGVKPISTAGNPIYLSGNSIIYDIKLLNKFADISTDGSGGPITNATGIYILAGSGTTDPTKNDYTLENVVPLTHMNGSVTASSTSFLTVSRTLKNDSTEPVTISEVGLFCNIARDANAGARAVTLFAREVLTSSFALPITMNPEEAYTFTFAL